MTESSSEPAVGIDLGTTYSVVAHLDTDGRPTTIVNAEGDLTTPSAVFFDGSSIIVGKEAIKAGSFDPAMIAQYAKRDMGKSKYHKIFRGEEIPPEVVQALVLKKIKHDASLKLGEFKKVVITVPAYFNEPRRKATQDAGRLAGLDVLDIINEPTAAAIDFGIQKGFLSAQGGSDQTERILVYDLGGGTFDISLMDIRGGDFKALATAGDVYLGGIDWDLRIIDYLAEEFLAQTGIDPRDDPSAMQRMIQEADDAKRSLSARQEVTIHFAIGGYRARVMLHREQFKEMTADLVERTLFTIRNLFRDIRMSWSDLTRVLLVGGSSRMPMIRESLERETGVPVDQLLSPDEAVAHGAAIYAGLLMGKAGSTRLNLRVHNVNSHDLGVLAIEIATGRKRRKILIKRNSALPARGASKFVTKKIGQARVAVNIVEGGDDSGNNATPIGTCIVSDLPSDLPAKSAIEVLFSYADNGRLKVKARLPEYEREATMSIERASGLTDEMLQEWEKRFVEGIEIGHPEPEPELFPKPEVPRPPPRRPVKKADPRDAPRVKAAKPSPPSLQPDEPSTGDDNLDDFLKGLQ